MGEIEGFFPTFLVSIATGRSHVLALDREGRVYSWGKNDFGQLGLGRQSIQLGQDRQQPTMIEEMGGEQDTKIV